MDLAPEIVETLAGSRKWGVQRADCLEWLAALPADSIDLCFFSPPYTGARLYLEDGKDMGIARDTEAWVRWMVQVFRECSRVCRGLVACVCEDQTKHFRWGAGPALLMVELHRAGFNLRKPPVYHRVGIPGSGGPDWFRNDYEFVVCITRRGKLPWSDNCATGSPPKWAPGGAMSYRSVNGDRKNAVPAIEYGKVQSRRKADGIRRRDGLYKPPALANPGNVISVKVGGGLMGHPLAHENEAPFPLALAEFFVRSCCPCGGVVLDCFGGSWTTAHAAVLWGRRFVGCDLRESMVGLAPRRLDGITPMLLEV